MQDFLSFKSIRDELAIELEKSFSRNSLAILVKGNDLMLIAPHSVKHDEWGTAELSWLLAKDLGSNAIIPVKNWSDSNEDFIFKKFTEFDIKMIVEFGGWKKDKIGVLSNNLDIMKSIVSFLSRFYELTSTRFHTPISKNYLYNYQLSYLRFEIPNNIRISAKESYKLYKILHSLLFKLKKLDFSPVIDSMLPKQTFCKYCSLEKIIPNILNLPIGIECLKSIDLWKVAKSISKGEFIFEELPKFAKPLKKRKKKECLICGKSHLTDSSMSICNDCISYVGTPSFLIELATNLRDIAEIEKVIHKKGRKEKDFAPSLEKDSLRVDLKRNECVICKKNITHNNVKLIRLRLCLNCAKIFHIKKLFEDLRSGNIGIIDFIVSSSTRTLYLKKKKDKNGVFISPDIFSREFQSIISSDTTGFSWGRPESTE